MREQTHDPSRDARYIRAATSKVFYQPPIPPKYFVRPPAAATIREEPPAFSPLAVVDGTDMPPEPPARTYGESNVAADS